ncbi:hypothetical protein ALUC_10250S [Aspergillus luchuensis]|nr:hypothetical protein ALUC_10250S [Aspergillus luchuensis]
MCKTPLAFLAHSLGGLVVKQAMVYLADEQSYGTEYQPLRDAIRGAIFFGVPSQGMDVSDWKAIVQGNPNENMIRNLSIESDFISKLTESFNGIWNERCKFFWAYEQLMSRQVNTGADGRLARNGDTIALVSPESATCGFNKRNPSVTIPISASHSGMVKFSQISEYLPIVRARLLEILQLPSPRQSNTDHDAQSDKSVSATESHPQPSPHIIFELLEKFQNVSKLTETEINSLTSKTLSDIYGSIHHIEMELDNVPNRINHLARLDPFTVAMKQFGKLTDDIKLFSHGSNSMGYVWGPMKFIVDWNTNRLGTGYHNSTDTRPYILLFQADIIRHLKLRHWHQLFDSWFKGNKAEFEQISFRTDQNRWLIEGKSSQQALEAARIRRTISDRVLEGKNEAATMRRDTVKHWLSAFDIQKEHFTHRGKRHDCMNPGRWLLKSQKFIRWARSDTSWNPLLWLSGAPGAGKSVLASIVIDRLKKRGASVAYFYCKHGDEKRTSVESVTRSILAQLLVLNPDLLPYFHDKAQTGVSLASPKDSEQILGTSLRSFERVYLVLDGLDECGRDARGAIARRFRKMVDLEIKVGSIRCLFISQDDGVAAADFHKIPSIKIGNQNNEDIENFVGQWQQQLVTKFGPFSQLSRLKKIISNRAKGLFIFAELFAKLLEQQLSIKDLEDQLRPEVLPVELDSLYERILDRVHEARHPNTIRRIDEILGWIVCARRPLRWEEIQTAVCIDLEERSFDDRRRLVESPKEMFHSLVVYHSNTTVELVHGTARQYLTKRKTLPNGSEERPLIKVDEGNFSLAMRCLTYLSFPAFHLSRTEEDIKSDLREGLHQLYDYATACWAMHLEGGILNLEECDLARLHKALKILVELHWSKSHKPIQITKEVRKVLSPFERFPGNIKPKQHNRLLQAVAWAKKQSGSSGKGPNDKDALTLWKVTAKIRSVLEKIDTESNDFAIIEEKYGARRYKCPRVNCYYYYHGFKDLGQRERHTGKHTRPYLCVVVGCPKQAFGYAVEEELRQHLDGMHCIKDPGQSVMPIYSTFDKQKVLKSRGGNASFQCPECDQTFTRKHNFRRHKESHTADQDRFICAKCTKPFLRKDAYERHVRTHDEKRFSCGGIRRDGRKWGCNRSFSRKDALKHHYTNTKRGQMCAKSRPRE